MKVCQLGCGIIGSAWVEHHLADGRDVVLWNRTPKAECPVYVADFEQATNQAEVFHLIVSDPQAVDEVLKRLPLGEGKLVIQSSTISPAWSVKNLEYVHSQGAEYVEAPFTGSKVAAGNRQCVFFVGGSPAAKTKAIEFIKPLSRKIFDMGTCEQAASIKVAMNLNIAGIFQALCESLTLARTQGISDELYFDVLAENVSKSGISDMKKMALCTGNFEPHFAVKHMRKDVRLALETMPSLPVTQRVAEAYDKAMEMGLSELDIASLIQTVSPRG